MVGKREPDQDLIDLLRELLIEAENGELSALAGLAEYHNRDAFELCSGTADWAAVAGRLLVLAISLASEDDD
jgi:hypothetical protein